MSYTVLVKYGEIGLKGKNKNFFVSKLVRNISQSAKLNKCDLERTITERDRLVCSFNDDNKELIIETLRNVLGIKYFSFVETCSKDMESMESIVEKLLVSMKEDGFKEVNFKTKRGDKRFPIKSPDINLEYIAIAKGMDLLINFKNKEDVIFTEISDKQVYIYSSSNKIQGFAGLPVGTSGKVLQLLSGGIDSPVSAFSMMRRGCVVDFIHFHSETSNEKAFTMKVRKLAETLNKFQFKCVIHMVPYSVYEMLTMGKIHPRYELVFFKHYILRVADAVAKYSFSTGLVTGDNLAQVASQTLDNMNAVSLHIDSQIYRPLLTYDKEDIVKVSRDINCFDLSVEQYKDCCSIHSKNPLTSAKIDKFEGILADFDMDGLIKETLAQTKAFKINSVKDVNESETFEKSDDSEEE
ncbi:MAG: tRNA 4-thiouridine(8) synthase ThiI [Nanoarchaeales archaeon]|nr:tRNA 4-thiouridine(8) synthase ThiI [Nanoarchaeales archaeon]